MQNKSTELFPLLQVTVDQLVQEFDKIPGDRSKLLEELTTFIQNKKKDGENIFLNFICTHNSRRSHMAQLWAQVAASYFGVNAVHCFSGGTEATAFNPRAVKALQDAGFDIQKTKDGVNPVYEVRFSKNAPPIISFSKKYDDPFNQHKDFAAIMTCSHADENCPLVLGASRRFAITYDDPKDFDDTPQEESKYKERVHQIGREMLFTFSGLRIK
jgi:arsenate reductase